ncbi:MAG: DUF2652 domain-containing protein [Daejeonella sp.]|uniref:DUF2652 domain-containing protein n=1 Tax=Daejeonella sp. TaxID=2805397 RepID=UPI00273387D9|nr:DUF2652 domain-containing protein [Daejeonella sp.]MDP3468497.1 DUF2652 domain-containing protein [Daejeonella sp.]
MEDKNGLEPAFFCVPDITGFTKFIATADINFTKNVIPALLRKLIECNILKMKIGEIEGDAIFFYKTGRLPSVGKVAEQCKIIYQTFSDFIGSVEQSDPENYDLYLADSQLGLKIIIHYGHISTANIKGRIKLLGSDVIIAHKLLKNAIEDYNYILLTDKYLSKIKDRQNLEQWFHWEKLRTGMEVYEYMGEVGYRYITLDDMTFMMDVKLSPVLRSNKKTS